MAWSNPEAGARREVSRMQYFDTAWLRCHEWEATDLEAGARR